MNGLDAFSRIWHRVSRISAQAEYFPSMTLLISFQKIKLQLLIKVAYFVLSDKWNCSSGPTSRKAI